MTLETFAEPVRLGGTARYVLWQSAFDFEVPDRVLRDNSGRIPAFATLEAASAYAAAKQLTLSSAPPGADLTHNLDMVIAWTERAVASTLDHDLVVQTWMFLTDAGVLPGMYEGGLAPELDEVVWQLDRAALVVLHPGAGHLAPEWTYEQISVLANTLRRGIDQFAVLLTVPAAV